jgi:large subunit ribosomal protein L4
MTVIKIKTTSSDTKSKSFDIKTPFRDLKYNPDFIFQVANGYLSNKRMVLASTKTRAQVSGTGKKPYKQKGTGHARFGSLRTPIHAGGGICFGPNKDKNFHKKLTKKMKKKSLAVVLDKKNQDKELFHISSIKLDKISTKQALSNIAKLPLKEGNILILTDHNDKKLYLSLRNVEFANVKNSADLNTLDALTHDNIVFVGNSNKNLFTSI